MNPDIGWWCRSSNPAPCDHILIHMIHMARWPILLPWNKQLVGVDTHFWPERAKYKNLPYTGWFTPTSFMPKLSYLQYLYCNKISLFIMWCEQNPATFHKLDICLLWIFTIRIIILYHPKSILVCLVTNQLSSISGTILAGIPRLAMPIWSTPCIFAPPKIPFSTPPK